VLIARIRQTGWWIIGGLVGLAIVLSLLGLAFWAQSAHAQTRLGMNTSHNSCVLPTTSGTTQPSGWEQYGADAEGRRCNPYEKTLGVNNVSSLHVAWSNSVENFIESSPVVSQGVLYITSDNPKGGVFAYNATTGAQIWSNLFPVDQGYHFTAPAVANGRVFVAANDSLYAFNATTGALLWIRGTSSIAQGWPVVYGSLVYFSSQAGRIFAFDQATGAVVWSGLINKNGGATTGIVVGGGLAYMNANNTLYAFNASNGHLVWRKVIEMISSPALGDGILYIDDALGLVRALNAATGQQIWEAQPAHIAGNIDSSPVIAYGYVYVGVGGSVWAFNAYTGALVTKMPTGDNQLASDPAIANGVVYVATFTTSSAATSLYAFSATTGAKLWSYAAGHSIYSSPIVTGGYFYISAYPVLYAFHT